MKFTLALSIICCACAALATTAGAIEIDVKKLGAKGDGKKDESAIIQKALTMAGKQGGGTVFLPAGKYRLDHALIIPTGVTLTGSWKSPHHSQQTGGTILLAYAGKGKEDGPALIELLPSSAVRGMTIFYPEQKLPDPIPYPWTIQGSGMHPSAEDITLVNPYKGIDFGSKPNELHYARNVYGCPLKIGVYLDSCTDIGRVENVHFNPHYWMRSDAKGLPGWNFLIDYLGKNLIAFDIGFSDWEMLVDTFSFGAKIGYRFRTGVNTPKGCNGSFVGIAADSATRAIVVEDCRHYGLLISNGQFVGKDNETIMEVAATNTGIVQLTNCAFWGKCGKAVSVDGKGSVSLSQCNFQHWDYSEKGLPAVEALDGDLIVQACQFQIARKQVFLGENVKTAVIQGNRFMMSTQIENKSKGSVEIGLNVVRMEP
ncbi:MAG: glycosyl hydrolase family 28-related protein [Armatimonadota bacterium]|nr:glycosyl hydrolase family 28-related protein [Armatimonadota bacterium]